MTRNTISNPFFHLEKPTCKEEYLAHLIQVLKSDPAYIQNIIAVANQPKYLFWDTFKHKALPGSLSREEQWCLVRFFRNLTELDTPIRTMTGEYFKWCRLPEADEQLDQVDAIIRGELFLLTKTSFGDRKANITKAIIEESIASSQLEGAHTSRDVAKKMIIEKKKPTNQSEQMILNNYQAMMALEEDYKNRELSRDMLLELHSLLTDKTLDDSEQKRFRKDSDEIVVQGMIGSHDYITHIPPPASMLEIEIDRLIEYANDQPRTSFTHPVVKAIFLHFWIGYLHPFTDGNGRLARTLFYWYLLKKGYWTLTYIPISTVIKKSPVQYAMAYIYSEQDEYDLTYFFNYQIRKIIQAIEEFSQYLQSQLDQNKQVESLLDNQTQLLLNDRQKQLLIYLNSEPDASTTTSAHSTIYNVSRQTATKDLKKMAELGLIKSQRAGKYVRYFAFDKLS